MSVNHVTKQSKDETLNFINLEPGFPMRHSKKYTNTNQMYTMNTKKRTVRLPLSYHAYFIDEPTPRLLTKRLRIHPQALCILYG